MQTTLFFVSAKGFGSSEHFRTEFSPPLELNKPHNYQLSLINASMWYSWFNITSSNNKFKYYNNTTWKEITVEPGAYNIVDINQIIKHHMKENGDKTDDSTPINITPNYNTLKSTIELKDGFQIDFTIEESLREILGFDSKIVQGNGFHSSDHNVKITDIESIQIHCDLVTDSFLNGSSSSVIYSFTPAVPPGYLINIHPAQTFYLNIGKKGLINSITLSVKDQNGKLINMNGERVTYFLHLSSFI